MPLKSHSFHRLLGVCLTLGFVLLLIAAHPAGATSLNLDAYHQVVQTALNDLQSGHRSPGQVATTLKSINTVRLPDGSTVEPDLAAIVDDLQPPVDQADAVARLTALLAQFDQSGRPGATNPDDATARLERVLARSEFKPAAGAKPQTFAGWLLHQIGCVLAPLLQPVGRLLLNVIDRLTPSQALRTIVAVVIGIIALAALGVWAVRGLRRGFAPGVARLPFVAPGERLNAVDLLQEAEELAGKRSYRLAIRALYLAALLRLDERGALSFDRALTNREVLTNAGKQGSTVLVERLAPLVERFDRHWYGAVRCTEDDYREFSRLSAWAWEST